ncbi:MAG TPA: TIM-barrel domain-containing protein [Bacteroidota bacterium]|nr:TIM-barrel domain-containing protein [Bacteroidota bacterium]
MKKVVLIGICIIVSASAMQAQIQHCSKKIDGVVFELSNRLLKLRVLSEALVQVIASPTKELPWRKSLSEVDNFKPTGKFVLKESTAEYILKTSKIVVKIAKADGAITFFDTNGHLLLAEQKGGRIFENANSPGDTAWVVEQMFTSPEDEAIFGLGQYQFDVMNWKNAHMRMKQQNTAIASPVIVSNKGYGLFWDNYSFTEFNPETKSIELHNIDENNVGTEFTPDVSGIYTFVLDRPGSVPMEVTLNGITIFRLVAGVGYSPSVMSTNLEAGKTYSINIKNLAKQIHPVISSKFLIPASDSTAAHGLKGEYFSNMNLQGTPAFVRIDSVIDFDWSSAPPLKGFKVEEYSVRWTGTLIPSVTIKNASIDVATDDGVRMYLNGKKVVDSWRDRSSEIDNYMMDLDSGKTYDIKIEYYQNGGGASARLSWTGESTKTDNHFLSQLALSCRAPKMAGQMSFKSHIADAINYYFIYGPEPDQVVSGVRTITGKAPLYPKWAYGLFMSHYGWKTQTSIQNIIDGYRSRKIPLDVVVQDADYWPLFPDNLWGSHRFDTARYSNPKAMVDHIHEQHAHTIISVWPRLNKGVDLYDSMNTKGYLLGLQETWSRSTEGVAMPNEAPNAAYDPFNPEARKLFWHFMNDRLFKLGFDGWWMDASEPEWGYDFSKAHTALGTGNRYLNAYPFMSKKGVYEGQRSTGSDKRPYILTRSSFVGQQRYAATTWNGDVSPDWDTYRKEIPAGLNYCITGLPYWTVDIGGFVPYKFVDSPEYPELLVRWYQYGTFLPILRVHGCRNTEFWNYDSTTVALLTKYTNLRYRLMPYIYSLGAKVTLDNYTIYRPLVMDFRTDPKVYNITDQFMFGNAFLVAPVVEQHAISRKVYLPKTSGGWIDFWTGKTYAPDQTIETAAPLETLPLFVKAGSIVPMGPFIQYAEEKTNGMLEVRVYPGADGSFALYEDENDNFHYEHGAYSMIPFSWNEKTKTFIIGTREGAFAGMIEKRKIAVVFVHENSGDGIAIEKRPRKEVLYTGHTVWIKE